MFARINLKIAFPIIFIFFILYSCLGSRNSAYESPKMNIDNQYKTLKIKLTKETSLAKSGFADSLTANQMDSAKNDKIPVKNKYPSPFCPLTTVNFEVLKAGEVIFELFDVKGDLVGKQIYSELLPDKYKINMNLIDVDSGIYFYRLINVNAKTVIKKMILLR